MKGALFFLLCALSMLQSSSAQDTQVSIPLSFVQSTLTAVLNKVDDVVNNLKLPSCCYADIIANLNIDFETLSISKTAITASLSTGDTSNVKIATKTAFELTGFYHACTSNSSGCTTISECEGTFEFVPLIDVGIVLTVGGNLDGTLSIVPSTPTTFIPDISNNMCDIFSSNIKKLIPNIQLSISASVQKALTAIVGKLDKLFPRLLISNHIMNVTYSVGPRTMAIGEDVLLIGNSTIVSIKTQQTAPNVPRLYLPNFMSLELLSLLVSDSLISNLLWVASIEGLFDLSFKTTIADEPWALKVTQLPEGPVAWFNQSMQTVEFNFIFEGTDGSDSFRSAVETHLGFAASIRPNGTAFEVYFALTRMTQIDSWDAGCTDVCRDLLTKASAGLGPWIESVNNYLLSHPMAIQNPKIHISDLVLFFLDGFVAIDMSFTASDELIGEVSEELVRDLQAIPCPKLPGQQGPCAPPAP